MGSNITYPLHQTKYKNINSPSFHHLLENVKGNNYQLIKWKAENTQMQYTLTRHNF